MMTLTMMSKTSPPVTYSRTIKILALLPSTCGRRQNSAKYYRE
jgi:hypothetical protein